MNKIKEWEVENDDGIFKIDLEKISFAGKWLSRIEFEDFYYHRNYNPRTREYFNISSKFAIKDIAIYYNNIDSTIALCFKNNKNVVKILEIKGHGGFHDLFPIKEVKAVDFNYNCGHATLRGKPMEIIKNFDDMNYEKILPFRRNDDYERI